MARNRQKAKERQARRKAQKGNGGEAKSAPERRHGGDPLADDVIDELERESVTDAGADPAAHAAAERVRAPARARRRRGRRRARARATRTSRTTRSTSTRREDQPEDVEDLTPGPRGRRGKEAEPDGEGGSRLVQFLKSVVAELRRVQWPDRQATTTLTGVVLGFVIIAGSYLGLLDAIFSRLVDLII